MTYDAQDKLSGESYGFLLRVLSETSHEEVMDIIELGDGIVLWGYTDLFGNSWRRAS